MSPPTVAPGEGVAAIAVCVPTYRRPERLAYLLRALAAQRGAPPFTIVVGNNDVEALESHDALRDVSVPRFHEIRVATRGVAAVRNALVAEALALRPSVDWVAFLDDDQEPADDWLASLHDGGERHRADLAGGPVRRTAGARTFWSEHAADTSYFPAAEGLVPTLNEAGNLLLSASYLRRLDRLPFSPDFGRTGGEDYEFFLDARVRGARIAWIPGARVVEPLPDDRLTLRHALLRFYSTAAYQARADRLHRGFGYALRRIPLAALRGVVAVARALVRDRSLRAAINRVVEHAATVAGRFAGLAGSRPLRYGVDADTRDGVRS